MNAATRRAGHEVRTKRVYSPADPADGFRVLVDRLWPRGETKDAAHVDLWLKEVAPSAQLRKWWNHDPDLLEEFTARYRRELDTNAAVAELRSVIAEHPVTTLLYGAKDPHLNQAEVLRAYLHDNP